MSSLACIVAFLVAIIWLGLSSYADFVVVQSRFVRNLGGKNLTVQKILGLPWDWFKWGFSGFIVWLLGWVCGLIGIWFLLLISITSFTIVGVLIVLDLQNIQSQAVAKLVILQGENTGKIFPLTNDYIHVGRRRSNTIVLQDPKVSRYHACFRFTQGYWYIQDPGSSAGIYVNGQLEPAKRLTSGDRIQIGSTLFEFRQQKP
jgi:hypothetical protein